MLMELANLKNSSCTCKRAVFCHTHSEGEFFRERRVCPKRVGLSKVGTNLVIRLPTQNQHDRVTEVLGRDPLWAGGNGGLNSEAKFVQL